MSGSLTTSLRGWALDADERERLVTDLGSTNAMILRNHGLLTLGRSVAEAWTTMWEFERALPDPSAGPIDRAGHPPSAAFRY